MRAPERTPDATAGPGLRCSRCGARVGPGDPVCPGCGALLESMRCGRCGHRGPRAQFRYNRCPICGHRGDLGGGFMGPVLVFAVVLLVLILSFVLAR